MPGSARPPEKRARVAISMAVIATFRTGTGMMPMPTFRFSVQARAAAADEMPPLRKQSSQSQSSSRPASSAARAMARRLSGGFCGSEMAPMIVMNVHSATVALPLVGGAHEDEAEQVSAAPAG